MTSIEWVVAVAEAIQGTPESWNPIRARLKETGQEAGTGLGGAGVSPEDPRARTGTQKVGWFCIHESGGCRNCYAETWNAWRGNGVKFRARDLDKVEIFLDEKVMSRPLTWKKRRAVFPCDMTDLFGPWVPDEWLDKIFAVMALTPHCVWMPLTKCAERMREYLTTGAAGDERRDDITLAALEIAREEMPNGLMRFTEEEAMIQFDRWPLANVWCGVSVEDQARADERIPALLDTPAAVRFVSAEPLLGPVNLSPWAPWLDWVIAGGESGAKARPMHLDWARGLRDQCNPLVTAFFFKQWGEWSPEWARSRSLRVNPKTGQATDTNAGMGERGLAVQNNNTMFRVGRKAAGRMLDGIVHEQIPAGGK